MQNIEFPRNNCKFFEINLTTITAFLLHQIHIVVTQDLHSSRDLFLRWYSSVNFGKK